MMQALMTHEGDSLCSVADSALQLSGEWISLMGFNFKPRWRFPQKSKTLSR